MALSRSKYKRLPDLYIVGTEVVFKDATVMWMQALNPFQVDEARHDAQVARSRLTMALKSEHGSDERAKVEAMFLADGHDAAVSRLVDAKVGDKVMEIVEAIHDDPEWKERVDLQERAEEIRATPASDAEIKLLEDVEREYVQEVLRRQQGERDFYQMQFDGMDDKGLIDAYIDWYIDRRGGTVAMAEYSLTEVWYAARVCEGTRGDDGSWDHGKCEGHQMQAFETKAEVRELPEDMQTLMSETTRSLNLTVRQAKNSDRQGSSSASSPLPSEPEASTPSTSDATPAPVPGT
jgi:hypothetical protein